MLERNCTVLILYCSSGRGPLGGHDSGQPLNVRPNERVSKWKSKRSQLLHCISLLQEKTQIQKKVLGRARRIVEYTFGIQANKWRIFQRPLNFDVDFTMNIVKCYCILHNFVHDRDSVEQIEEYLGSCDFNKAEQKLFFC
jgi:hypothetical protein